MKQRTTSQGGDSGNSHTRERSRRPQSDENQAKKGCGGKRNLQDTEGKPQNTPDKVTLLVWAYGSRRIRSKGPPGSMVLASRLLPVPASFHIRVLF